MLLVRWIFRNRCKSRALCCFSFRTNQAPPTLAVLSSCEDHLVMMSCIARYSQNILNVCYLTVRFYSGIVTIPESYLKWIGYPVEFFIEGTRSRSGKMIQPKLGLLSIVTDLFFEDNQKPTSTPRTRFVVIVMRWNGNLILTACDTGRPALKSQLWKIFTSFPSRSLMKRCELCALCSWLN